MKYQPLKIEFHLEFNEAVISHNPFDSVLARLYYDDLKSKNEFDGDYTKRIPFLKWNENGFYHASNPFYKIEAIDNYSFAKSFDVKLYENYGKKPDLSAIRNILGGRFKSWIETFEKESISKVVYFVNANQEELIEYLKKLRFLGKKASIGFGKIKKFTITELNEDYSVIKDNTPMRYLPDIQEYSTLDNRYKSKKRLVHPYWSKKDLEVCIVPERREYEF